MKKLYILLIIAFMLQLATTAGAVSLELSCNVTGLTCDNSGVYTLRGVDFVNVAGVQVEIQYDNTTLQNPSVTKGALLPATATINPAPTPSSIIIAAGSGTTPSNGTGLLATIRFTPVGATAGNVSIQSSKLILPGGTKIPHSDKNPADFISDLAAAAAAQAAADAKTAEEAAAAAKAKADADAAAAAQAAATAQAAADAKAAADAAAQAAADAKATADAAAKTAADAEAKAAADAAAAAKTKADADAKAAAAAAAMAQADADAKARAEAQSRAAAAASAAAAAAADAKSATSTQVAIQSQAYASGASVALVGTPSIGTITLPPDQMASTDRKAEYQPLVTDLRGDMTIPSSGGGSTAQTAGDQQPAKDKTGQENRSVSYKSVLQLFREFSGEKSAKALIALFAEGAVPNFSQNPPVALSDGITPVRLTLTLKQGGTETPKFMLQGASVKEMGSEGEGQVVWTIDALPKKGAYDARLTVIDGQNIMEFPLVVAPPIGPLVPKAQKFTEADFTLYLSSPAKFDLNKDQKFDSLDDYIFTTNYINALKIKPEKLKKDEPLPGQKGDVKTKDSQGKKEDKSK